MAIHLRKVRFSAAQARENERRMRREFPGVFVSEAKSREAAERAGWTEADRKRLYYFPNGDAHKLYTADHPAMLAYLVGGGAVPYKKPKRPQTARDPRHDKWPVGPFSDAYVKRHFPGVFGQPARSGERWGWAERKGAPTRYQLVRRPSGTHPGYPWVIAKIESSDAAFRRKSAAARRARR